MPRGDIILFDPRTCWAIIRPDDASCLLPAKVEFEVSHHLHLHSSVSLIVSKEYDETTYAHNMDYDMSKEDDSSTYRRLVLWDPIHNYAVVTNETGRLKITSYSNKSHTIPENLWLPPHCQIFLSDL